MMSLTLTRAMIEFIGEYKPPAGWTTWYGVPLADGRLELTGSAMANETLVPIPGDPQYVPVGQWKQKSH